MPTEHEKTAASNRSTNGVSSQTSGTSSLQTVISQALGSKLDERLESPRPRREQPASRIAPQGDELVDEIFRRPDPEQVVAQRPALALRAPLEPEGSKLVWITAEPRCDLILELPPGNRVKVDQRVPEVEDDRAGHAFRTRTAVP